MTVSDPDWATASHPTSTGKDNTDPYPEFAITSNNLTGLPLLKFHTFLYLITYLNQIFKTNVGTKI
jgi:hypothetical protein